jgi:hypothetical protein
MSQTTDKPEVFGVGTEWQDCLRQLYSKWLTRPIKSRIKFVYNWAKLSHDTASPLFLVTSLDELGDPRVRWLRGPRGREKKCLIFTGGLPIEAVVARTARLNVRSPRNIHLADVQEHDAKLELVKRLLTSIAISPDAPSIVDAWWEGDYLVILRPSFERLSIPARAIPGVRDASQHERENFEIQQDGAYVYWPDLDVHMSWDAFAQAVDPNARLKAQQRDKEFNVLYGKAIRLLRKEHGLNQSDIVGLNERHVGRIEKGECRATLSSLKKLATTHRMSVSEYMSKLADYVSVVEDSDK